MSRVASRDWMPHTRESQLAKAELWLLEMTAHKTEWGIPDTYLTTFQQLTTAARLAYNDALTSERTKSLTARLNACFEPMCACMRDGKRRYLFIPPLTEEQYVRLLGHLKDDTPSYQGPPDAQFRIMAMPIGPHMLKLTIEKLAGKTHPESGGDWRAAIYHGIMPPGGATLEQAAGPKHYLREFPKDGEILLYRKATHRKFEKFEYPSYESSMSTFYGGRYENGKDNPGPWGPITGPFVIP